MSARSVARPILIEILFTPECGHLDETRAIVEEALADLPIPSGAEIAWRQVSTEEQADELGFVGSPTVRVNGRDVAPTGTENRPREGHCRMYPAHGGVQPYPDVADVRDALRDASS